MSVPKAITDTIAVLRAERGPLASRLDAIDLAIDNLSRVYGLHGTPQPLPLERRQKPERRAGRLKTPDDAGAVARRDLLLVVIGKSEVGLTLGELRKHTAKMDGKDRSNALQALKALGKIKRVGNAWQAAA